MTPATVNKRVSLSEREREILRLVVQSFIETAGPVGSRFLARRFPLGLSPASIRNTMSDLEEGGFLEHPYTSAGRVPTDSGYRLFVADLMSSHELSAAEKKAIRSVLDELVTDTEQLLRETSRLLGKLTNLLGLVLSPRLSAGILERLEEGARQGCRTPQRAAGRSDACRDSQDVCRPGQGPPDRGFDRAGSADAFGIRCSIQ
jgi:heat-inducible transcriptional repressor